MSGYPVRQESAHGQPRPSSPFLRDCKSCGASFADLHPGKDGEYGIWGGCWRWYCSVECAPEAPDAG